MHWLAAYTETIRTAKFCRLKQKNKKKMKQPKTAEANTYLVDDPLPATRCLCKMPQLYF